MVSAWKFRNSFATVALGTALSACVLLGPQQPARAFLPGVVVPDAVEGGYTTSGVDSSFGWFFTVANPIQADGLGFFGEKGWLGGGGASYTVALWECFGGCTQAADFNPTPLAQVTFDPAINFYTLQKNYWWQSISPLVTLDPSSYYVLGAYGDYSEKPGNVQYIAGTPAFNPNIVVDPTGINAFNENDPSFDVDGLYPIPAYPGLDEIKSISYFNPNISLVPGPLPALGALGAYGWARKLRRRVRGSI